jgi:hypothetical protein
MSEPTPPAAPTSPAAATAKPAPPPPRPLPSEDDIARWANGEDVPLIGALFEQLDLAKFDLLVTQIRKEELLPQHWQPLPTRALPDESVFDALPEIGRLRVLYRDHDLSQRRVEALRAGWRALRGKRPGLWEAADFYAAYRRLLQQKIAVSAYELLTALRDVWRTGSLPRGKEQLVIQWHALVQARRVTKK